MFSTCLPGLPLLCSFLFSRISRTVGSLLLELPSSSLLPERTNKRPRRVDCTRLTAITTVYPRSGVFHTRNRGELASDVNSRIESISQSRAIRCPDAGHGHGQADERVASRKGHERVDCSSWNRRGEPTRRSSVRHETSTKEGSDRACKSRVYRPRSNNDSFLMKRSCSLRSRGTRCTSYLSTSGCSIYCVEKESRWTAHGSAYSRKKETWKRSGVARVTEKEMCLDNGTRIASFYREKQPRDPLNVRNVSRAHQKRTGVIISGSFREVLGPGAKRDQFNEVIS